MTFKVGDVVVLRSGGAKMTVESVGEEIGCVWSDGKKTIRDMFNPATLCEGASVEDFLNKLNATGKQL